VQLNTNVPLVRQSLAALSASKVARLAKRNPSLAQVLCVLNAAGVDPKVRYGKHIRVSWRSPGGEHRLIIIPMTTRRTYAARCAGGQVRRLLRRDGMEAQS
jgi:hypothetical protein